MPQEPVINDKDCHGGLFYLPSKDMSHPISIQLKKLTNASGSSIWDEMHINPSRIKIKIKNMKALSFIKLLKYK